MRLAVLLLLALGLASTALAQPLRDERGDRSAERKTILDGNRVGLTVFNYGLAGGSGEVRGDWPRGSNDIYLGDLSLVVVAEVQDASGTTVRIAETHRSPRAGTNTPPGQPGVFWGFEAVPGYAAPGTDGFARSDDAATWPEVWPDRAGDPAWTGVWDGLLGRDRFIDGVELYSHLSDSPNQEHAYTPDPQNPERGGLGIVVEQRVLAFRDPLFEDAVVFVYDVHNASPRDLDRVALGSVAGPLIGGDGDSQDDCAVFDPARGMVTAYDFDHSGNSNQPVGRMALAFVPEARGAGLTMQGMLHFTPPSALRMNDDERLWRELTRQGETGPDEGGVPEAQCLRSGGVDGDVIAGTGAFALPAFSSRRFIVAVVLGADQDAVDRAADRLRGFVWDGFELAEDGLAVTAPAEGASFGAEPIDLAWTQPAEGVYPWADLAYSADFGQTWTPIVEGLEGANTYLWTPEATFPSGTYRLRVTTYGPDGLRSAATGPVTINPGGGDTAPQVALVEPQNGLRYAGGTARIRWEAGDADGDALTVTLAYTIADGGWVPFATDLPASGAFDWDVSGLPNSARYRVRVEATDGTTPATDASPELTVRNERFSLQDDALFERSGDGDGLVEVRVADPAAVTGDVYRVTFSEAVTTGSDSRRLFYTVVNETTGQTVVPQGFETQGQAEGPLFDGLRLWVQDVPTRLDQSFWTDPAGLPDLDALVANIPSFGLQGTAAPFDYEVRFSDAPTGRSTARRLGSRGPTVPATDTYFTIHNVTLDQPVDFSLLEAGGSEDGRLDPGEGVFLYEALEPGGPLEPTFALRPGSEPSGTTPGTGDVFVVQTIKPLGPGDALRFQALVGTPAAPGPEGLALSVSAPWPNPARQAARLAVSVAAPGPVRVVVHDVLGRRVAVPFDGVLQPGEPALVDVDTRAWAAGLYLITVEADAARRTRRLTVVR